MGVPVALGSMGPRAGDTKRDLFSRLPDRSHCWGSPPGLLQGPRSLGAPAGPHALPAAAAHLMTGGTYLVSLEGKPPNHQLLLNSMLEFRRDLVLKVGHVLVRCRLHHGAFRVELRAAAGSLSTSLPRRRVSYLRQQAGHASRVQAQPEGKREKQILCRGLEKGTHSGARGPELGPSGWVSSAATCLRQ